MRSLPNGSHDEKKGHPMCRWSNRSAPVLAALAAGLMVASYGSATTHHVDGATGIDQVGCGTTADPCATIQFAVNLAQSGDEIRVASGTQSYPGAAVDPCDGAPIEAPAVVCVLNTQVTIRGGFEPPDWSQPAPGGLTTLDGGSTRRVVLVLRTAPTAPETALTLEDARIHNGRAEGQSSGSFNEISAYGGGLLADNSRIVLRRVEFVNNRVVGGSTSQDFGGDGAGGGAMLRGVRSGSILESVSFTTNEARGGNGSIRGGYGLGGGLGTCCGTTLTVLDLNLASNTAQGGSSAGSGDLSGARGDGLGGGAAFGVADFGDGTGGSTVTIEGAVVTGNTAQGGAGTTAGAYAAGGGLFVEGKTLDPSTLILRGAVVTDNQALGGSSVKGGPSLGGGITAADASLVVERSALTRNSCVGGTGGSGAGSERGSGLGGGIHAQKLGTGSPTVQVRNTIIAHNTAAIGASGDLFLGGGGGGMTIQGSLDPILEHVTFAGNILNSNGMLGHAIALVAFPATPTVDLKYSIVAGHSDPAGPSALHAQSGTVFNLDSGLFSENWDDTNVGAPGAGSFVGLGSYSVVGSVGFASPGLPDLDYHLLPSSPAIDPGSGSAESVDFEGQSRDAFPDHGADELGTPDGIFEDGFESGSFGAWSTSVG